MTTSSQLIVSETLDDMAQAIRAESPKQVTIGLTTIGSEITLDDLVTGAKIARDRNPGLEVAIIGEYNDDDLIVYNATNEDEVHQQIQYLLENGKVDGVVTMHYPFPIGVATVGKVVTPARGKAMYISTSTGTSDTNRAQAMVKNAVYGLAVAKADGVEDPTLGILNVDAARQVERHLNLMRKQGYHFTWGQSLREDGGQVLRGNDIIMGAVDVLVTDTLTGNILMKLFSSSNSGGNYETVGYGYGPGVGAEFNHLICIISRASGTPVVTGAIEYCASMVRGKLNSISAAEIQKAQQAGWNMNMPKTTEEENTKEEILAPPQKIVDTQIQGIDILELDDAVKSLWKEEIFAASGMGCTGPIILVAGQDLDRSVDILKQNNYIS